MFIPLGRLRSITGRRVAFEPSSTIISATSASSRARQRGVGRPLSSSIWKMVLDVSSFLLTTTSILSASASAMYCISSISAIVFATPASRAIMQPMMFISEDSLRPMKASAESIPSSRSTSMSRWSALTTVTCGAIVLRRRHFSGSASMTVMSNSPPMRFTSWRVMRSAPEMIMRRIWPLTAPHCGGRCPMSAGSIEM